MAADVSAPPMSSGRTRSRTIVERPVDPRGRERVEGVAADVAGSRERDDRALAAGRGRQAHRGRGLGEAQGEPLLEPERRVERGQVARQPGRGEPRPRIEAARSSAERRGRRVVEPEAQQRVEVAVGQQRLDLDRRRVAPVGHRRSPRPRSRATVRSARWMRTRTAPSDRPRTPAISAVDISSTKRRTIARRRSAGSRPTARHAAPASSRRAASASTSSGSATVAAASSGCPGAGGGRALAFGDDVAGDPEEPDAERRGASPSAGPGALLEPGEVRQGREERALGGVLGVVMVAELVVGVAVHLGEVPAIQGVEPGRVGRAASTSARSRSRWATRGDRRPPPRLPSTTPARHSVTPRPARRCARRRWRISPTRTDRARRRDVGSSTMSAPRPGRRPSPGRSRRRRRAARADRAPFVSWRSASRPVELPRGAPRSSTSRRRGTRRAAARRRSAPAATPRRDVIVAASSGGNSSAAQSTLTPMPMTTRGSCRPEAVGLAEHARRACGRRPRRARSPSDSTQVVRPLQPDRAGRQPGRPPRPHRPSRARRSPPAARRARARARSGGSRATAAAPPGRRRPRRGRRARDPPTARRRPRGRPPASPRRASRGRRRSSSRRRRIAPGARGTAAATTSAGRRGSTASGRSSSNAPWSARRPSPARPRR